MQRHFADGQHAGLGHHSLRPKHVQTSYRLHAHLALRTAATRASWSGRAAAASAGQPACCRKRRSWSPLAAARSASASAVCMATGESQPLSFFTQGGTQAWCKQLQTPRPQTIASHSRPAACLVAQPDGGHLQRRQRCARCVQQWFMALGAAKGRAMLAPRGAANSAAAHTTKAHRDGHMLAKHAMAAWAGASGRSGCRVRPARISPAVLDGIDPAEARCISR